MLWKLLKPQDLAHYQQICARRVSHSKFRNIPLITVIAMKCHEDLWRISTNLIESYRICCVLMALCIPSLWSWKTCCIVGNAFQELQPPFAIRWGALQTLEDFAKVFGDMFAPHLAIVVFVPQHDYNIFHGHSLEAKSNHNYQKLSKHILIWRILQVSGFIHSL